MQSIRISRHNLSWQIPALISAMVLAISLVLVVPIVLDAQVSMAAQPGRSGQMRPVNGNELMVEFEQGDVRFPYVIGSLWSDSDTPPASNNDS